MRWNGGWGVEDALGESGTAVIIFAGMPNIKYTRKYVSINANDDPPAKCARVTPVAREDSESETESGFFMTDSDSEGEKGEEAIDMSDGRVSPRMDITTETVDDGHLFEVNAVDEEIQLPRNPMRGHNREDLNVDAVCHDLLTKHKTRVFVFSERFSHMNIYDISRDEAAEFMDMKTLMGMDEMMKLLKRHILYPLLNPALYTGNRFPSHYMCMCGRSGSGKRTAIRAFVRHFRINLIEVQPFWNVANLMECLIEGASQLAPCMIYFDECDHHFSNVEDPVAWWRQINCFCDKVFEATPDVEVWMVIGSRINPVRFADKMPARLADHFVVVSPPTAASKQQYMALVSACGKRRGPTNLTPPLSRASPPNFLPPPATPTFTHSCTESTTTALPPQPKRTKPHFAKCVPDPFVSCQRMTC